MTQPKKDTSVFVIALLGLCISLLAGYGEQVELLRPLCAAFSDGCRVTEAFTLLGVKVWIWGAVFYAVLAVCALDGAALLAWLIPVALGVELSLAGIMAFMQVSCVYCLANAGVVAMLALMRIPLKDFWRAFSLAMIGLLVSGLLLTRENGLAEIYCARIAPPHKAQPERPAPPATADIPLDGSQTLGPDTALITVVEFSDFRCPACRRMHKVVEEAQRLYGERVRWVFKNFPLPMHKDAQIAAEGALCAADQGRFWEYQAALYATEEEYTRESLGRIAGEKGLDAEAFGKCLDAGTHKAQIEKELQSGLKAGLDAVPSFVVNGRVVVGGRPLADFKAIIDEELARAGAK